MSDHIDRIRAFIHWQSLNPDKSHASPEALDAIALLADYDALAAERDEWQACAFLAGEYCGETVGPTGYYEFTPTEFKAWFVTTAAYKKPALQEKRDNATNFDVAVWDGMTDSQKLLVVLRIVRERDALAADLAEAQRLNGDAVVKLRLAGECIAALTAERDIAVEALQCLLAGQKGDQLIMNPDEFIKAALGRIDTQEKRDG